MNPTKYIAEYLGPYDFKYIRTNDIKTIDMKKYGFNAIYINLLDALNLNYEDIKELLEYFRKNK